MKVTANTTITQGTYVVTYSSTSKIATISVTDGIEKVDSVLNRVEALDLGGWLLSSVGATKEEIIAAINKRH